MIQVLNLCTVNMTSRYYFFSISVIFQWALQGHYRRSERGFGVPKGFRKFNERFGGVSRVSGDYQGLSSGSRGVSGSFREFQGRSRVRNIVMTNLSCSGFKNHH